MVLCKPMPNTIINGDCALVLKEFEPECIDLTVTSPPYDNLRDYEGYHFDFEAIAQQLFRVTKQGGVVVWVVGDETIDCSETCNSDIQKLYFKSLGFFVETMIYQKDNPMPQYKSPRYTNAFEFMFVFSKGLPKTFNALMERSVSFGRIDKNYKGQSFANGVHNTKSKKVVNKNKILTNIWSFDAANDIENNGHPAQFPMSLARNHILTWSNPGDLVLDPMCGSGTTLKMAKQTGRNYIGIDTSEKYCKLSEKRVERAQTPLLLEFGQSNTRVQPTGGTVRQNELFPNE